MDETAKLKDSQTKDALGLGLRLADGPEDAPGTPPPHLQTEFPAVPVAGKDAAENAPAPGPATPTGHTVPDIEIETTPEDKTPRAETRTPPNQRYPESPSARLSVASAAASPRPPQSPRSPLRDHIPLHHHGHGHESFERVEVMLPKEDDLLMVPAICIDSPDSASIDPHHPVAIDTAVFHEVTEDPLQTSNPPSPFPRSPRRSPLSSPQRHRSPISSPRPGHSPSPTSKLSWHLPNHHPPIAEKDEHEIDMNLTSSMVSPSQLAERLAQTTISSPHDEDDASTVGKRDSALEPGTPDSESTNVAEGASNLHSHPVSRIDTLDLNKAEPVKIDSGIDLVHDEQHFAKQDGVATHLEQGLDLKQPIPRFFFRSMAEIEESMDEGLRKQWQERDAEVKEIIDAMFKPEEGAELESLTEATQMMPFTLNALSLPRYFNASCWRLAENESRLLSADSTGISKEGLENAWRSLKRGCGRTLLYEPLKDDTASLSDSRAGDQVISDVEAVAFYVVMDPARLRDSETRRMRKRGVPEQPAWLSWDDLELVVNDIVRNHPGLDFLQPLPIFQERYKDTVLARLMYLKPDFWDGRMTLRQFKATNFVRMVAELEENAEMTAQGQQVVGGVGDVNTTRDIFSYKHFYVIYCRFWELDTDHDMVISGKELLRYDLGRMTRRTVRRVVEALGRFIKPPEGEEVKLKMEDVRSTERNWFRSLPEEFDPADAWQDAKLEYRDFVWVVLLVEDKSVPSAVSFWFRVLDTDDDGILCLHELRGFWEEQIKRMREGRTGIPDPRNPTMVPGYWCGEIWDWPDFICNLLDLSHCGMGPADGLYSADLPPLTDPEKYDESYIHVTLPALRSSNHAAHFYDLVFDLRSYDVHQRRMEPSFREADDVWVCDEDGNRKFKLRGWEKFSERQYEILANEERLAAQQQARAQQRQAQEKRNTRRLLFDDSNKAARTQQQTDDSGDESSAKEDEVTTSRRRTK